MDCFVFVKRPRERKSNKVSSIKLKEVPVTAGADGEIIKRASTARDTSSEKMQSVR
jgi:hypothetical protein